MKRILLAILLTAGLLCVGLGEKLNAATFDAGYQDLLDAAGNPGSDGVVDTGDWNWNDAATWNTGSPPVNGETFTIVRKNWANPIGLDVSGGAITLPNSELSGDYNGSQVAFYNSAHLTPIYKAAPVNNQLLQSLTSFTPIGGASTLQEAADASPAFTVGRYFANKQHVHNWMMPLIVDNSGTKNGEFRLEATHVTAYSSLSVDGNLNLVGRNDSTTSTTVHGLLTVGGNASLNRRAVLNVLDGAAISGAVTVDYSDNNTNNESYISLQGGAYSSGAVTVGTGKFQVDSSSSPTSINVNGDFKIGDASYTVGNEYSVLEFILGPNGTVPIEIDGNLLLDNEAEIVIDGSAFSGDKSLITLMTFNGLEGAFLQETISGPNLDGYTLQYLSNSLVLANYIVPEPSTYALGLFGIVGVALALRRRRM